MSKVKTGEIVKFSGLYQPEGTKHTITLSKGDVTPPYHNQAKKFNLVEKTK
ncbi:MAG: hypothetical protein NTW06_03985 [Candidatus Falkowbacteria bacterium]|nr:hypothetical protein [Candidatus Falkowbacteria bacterium]